MQTPYLLYGELVPWYRLLDPLEDHQDEAAWYREVFAGAVVARAESLLELGAGAGNNAYYLKPHFRCTLTDLSQPMLGLSRSINPECQHKVGDMRKLRLGSMFDAVLVHDAICYMTTEDDVRAVVQTAFAHTRPGGAAIFAPDYLQETFRECAQMYQGKDGGRALRCIEWMWDPDTTDTTYTVEYAFLLRQGSDMRAVNDRHVEGLFSRETWLAIFREVGYSAATIARPIGDGETDEVFLCRRRR